MKPAIWHSEHHYTPSRFGVDGLIVIECAALALFVLAVTWLDFLTQ